MRVPTTFLALGTILASGSVWAQETDWQQVDAILGRKPAVSADVHRYGFPRTDLSVTLDGVAIKPALALGGWVAFKPTHGGAMIMGDLVLLETEINPVMAKLIEGGLQITAVHNHLLRANPRPFTCTLAVMAIQLRWRTFFAMRCPRAKRRYPHPQRLHRRPRSTSTRRNLTKRSAPRSRQRWCVPICRAASRPC